MLMVAHSKPAAPLFPSTSEAAVVDPLSAIDATISLRPSLRSSLRFGGEAAGAGDVSLALDMPLYTKHT